MTKTKLFLWTLAVLAIMTIGALVGNYVNTIYRHVLADHNELHAISKWAVQEIQSRPPRPKPSATVGTPAGTPTAPADAAK